MQVLRTGHSTHVVTQVLRNPNKRPSITFMACEKRILPALDCVKNGLFYSMLAQVAYFPVQSREERSFNKLIYSSVT